jgi:hypothetical protein
MPRPITIGNVANGEIEIGEIEAGGEKTTPETTVPPQSRPIRDSPPWKTIRITFQWKYDGIERGNSRGIGRNGAIDSEDRTIGEAEAIEDLAVVDTAIGIVKEDDTIRTARKWNYPADPVGNKIPLYPPPPTTFPR